jgi:hypothetical protein
VINEIVAAFRCSRSCLRRRRLRDRLDGDHQGRAQHRQREEVRRLGSYLRRPEDRLRVKEYAIPTNKNVQLPPTVPALTEFKVINYDFAKYGASDTRKRLLERWEKEIGQATK